MSSHSDSSELDFGGYLVIGAIILFFGWVIFSGAQQNEQLDREAKYETITAAVDDMEGRYGELIGQTSSMIQGFDNECVWQGDNLNDEIGDYCADAVLGDYAVLNNGDLELDADDYIDSDDAIEDALSALVDDANGQYNSIVYMAEDALSAMEEQCSWVADNASSEIGDYCFDTMSGYDFSTDPFSAYDYN